jgi:hypothetical protein
MIYEVAKEGLPWVKVEAVGASWAAHSRYGDVEAIGSSGELFVFITNQEELIKVRKARFTRNELEGKIFTELNAYFDNDVTELQQTERIMDLVDLYVESL